MFYRVQRRGQDWMLGRAMAPETVCISVFYFDLLEANMDIFSFTDSFLYVYTMVVLFIHQVVGNKQYANRTKSFMP